MYRKFIIFLVFAVALSSCHLVKRIPHRNQLTAMKQGHETEAVRLKLLETRNDSLVQAGFYSEKYAKTVQEQIQLRQLSNDSGAAIINKVLRTVNFRVGYEEQYYETRKKIKQLQDAYTKQLTGRNEAYSRIEKLMQESDLAGEKKALVTILNNASAKQEEAKAKAGEIGNTADAALQTGAIDSSTAQSFDLRLTAYLREIDSISTEISVLKNRLEQPADFSKNFNVVKSRVLLIDSVVNSKAVFQQYVFRMMEDGLSKSKRTMFSLAAFFGPGGYIIPVDKYEVAELLFRPVLDSLQMFSNTYSEVLRKAQVAVIGYADGARIAPGSPLYKKIAAYLKKRNPSKEELNQGLSGLRAEEISRFMERMIKERAGEFTSFNKVVFELLEKGAGEEFPDRAITDYKQNDDRRRIVMIYWSVVPMQ